MAAHENQLVEPADHVALARLVTEAAWRVDEGKSETLHELFVDEAELDLGGSVLKGREAIRNWGRQLEKTQAYKCIRHVVGNMRFFARSPDVAEGVAVLTVFMDDEGRSSVPWLVGEDHDRFIRTADGWRIARRRWVQLFARPGWS